MAKDSRPVCVVMGDLVRRKGQHPAAELQDIFYRAVASTSQRPVRRLASPLTITLGDVVQGITPQLTDAIPVVRSLWLALMRQGLDCRFVIGQVALMSPLNPQVAWTMMGPGLGRARAKRNEKLSSTPYRFAFLQDPLAEPLADALGAGLTGIKRDGTARQRDLINRLKTGQSAADLAAEQGNTAQSI